MLPNYPTPCYVVCFVTFRIYSSRFLGVQWTDAAMRMELLPQVSHAFSNLSFGALSCLCPISRPFLKKQDKIHFVCSRRKMQYICQKAIDAFSLEEVLALSMTSQIPPSTERLERRPEAAEKLPGMRRTLSCLGSSPSSFANGNPCRSGRCFRA